MQQASQRLRELVPPHATVLTTVGWWALASDHHVVDPHFSDVADLSRIDFFVADGNAAGAPGSWREPANSRYKQMIAEQFEMVADDLPRKKVTLLGHPISHSAYGFGAVVMRRRAAAREDQP